VALAEAVRRESIPLFDVDPDHVVTIPNGVDVRRLVPSRRRDDTRRRLGIDADAPLVLSVAALTWEKDPSAHIRVGTRVIDALPEARHLIVGDGPLRDRAAAEVSSLGRGDAIACLGSRSDVADLLAAADVVLFASRPDGMEGMPTILIEAGMLGVPVAGFDVAGASEVVVSGETGLLVPWGDEAALARAVLTILRERAVRARMGEAARRLTRDRFDLVPIAGRYAVLYQEILAR
jgi:glycosyltransferase involved in cell wall biosynthesis